MRRSGLGVRCAHNGSVALSSFPAWRPSSDLPDLLTSWTEHRQLSRQTRRRAASVEGICGAVDPLWDAVSTCDVAAPPPATPATDQSRATRGPALLAPHPPPPPHAPAPLATAGYTPQARPPGFASLISHSLTHIAGSVGGSRRKMLSGKNTCSTKNKHNNNNKKHPEYKKHL